MHKFVTITTDYDLRRHTMFLRDSMPLMIEGGLKN